MRTLASKLALSVFCLAAVSFVSPAHAATYFTLATTGGTINPGIYVGFNPQPDPPGTPPTTLLLNDSFFPLLTYVPPGPCTQESSCSAGLVLSFTGIGSPTLNPPPDPEKISNNADLNFPISYYQTGFNFSTSGHDFSVTLDIYGPTSLTDWTSFNPQPDPPGDGFAYQFSFLSDPAVGLSITEDGTNLNFAETPLPPSLPLLFSGIGTLGLLGWRRKNKAAAVAG